jgi:very-short-patch-repair endonuclease
MRDDEKRSRGFARQLRRRLTDAEVILWSRLKIWPGVRFRRQHPIGVYIADFACIRARLVIEVDGDTHARDCEIAYDTRRTSYLEARGWRVLRVSNEDIYRRLNDVTFHIAALLSLHRCAVPLPRLRGRKVDDA